MIKIQGKLESILLPCLRRDRLSGKWIFGLFWFLFLRNKWEKWISKEPTCLAGGRSQILWMLHSLIESTNSFMWCSLLSRLQMSKANTLCQCITIYWAKSGKSNTKLASILMRLRSITGTTLWCQPNKIYKQLQVLNRSNKPSTLVSLVAPSLWQKL